MYRAHDLNTIKVAQRKLGNILPFLKGLSGNTTSKGCWILNLTFVLLCTVVWVMYYSCSHALLLQLIVCNLKYDFLQIAWFDIIYYLRTSTKNRFVNLHSQWLNLFLWDREATTRSRIPSIHPTRPYLKMLCKKTKVTLGMTNKGIHTTC